MKFRSNTSLSTLLLSILATMAGSCGGGNSNPVAVVPAQVEQLSSLPDATTLPLISDVPGLELEPSTADRISLATVNVIASGLGFPYGLDVNSTGNFIVVDYMGRLLEITPAGDLSVIASSLSLPTGVTVDGDNYLVVTFGGQLLEITPSSSISVRATGLGSAYGVVVDGSDVIVTDYVGRLLRISGGSVSQVATGIGNPAGVEVLGTDDYLVTDFVGGRLWRVTGGTPTLLSSGLSFPTEVIEVDGRFLVGEFGSTPGSGGRLLEVDPSSGDLSEIASASEVNGNVFGLADLDGSFFATDFLNGGRVLQIEPDPVDECPTGVELLVDPGFEVQDPGMIPQTEFGIWGGDLSDVVGPQDGITPLEGSRMLNFLATGPSGGGGVAAQIFQLVDLSSLSSEIDAGQITVKGSAFYNRVAGDSETDTEFAVLLSAYGGTPETSGFPDRAAAIELSQGILISDGDPSTWENAETVFTLPPGTRFLAYETLARENISDDAVNEFDGHYGDDTSLILCGFDSLPKPSGSGLLIENPSSIIGFGTSLDVGDHLFVVGASGLGGRETGAAFVFNIEDGGLVRELVAPDDAAVFGAAVAVFDDRVLVGAPNEFAPGTSFSVGAAYLLDAFSGVILGELSSPVVNVVPGQFGGAVDLDEDTIVVGAPRALKEFPNLGAAFLFDYSGNLLGEFTNPDTQNVVGAITDTGFGESVSISEDMVLIGSPSNDTLGIESSGAAFLFDIPTGDLIERFVSPSPASSDQFGRSVSLFGNYALIGAPFDDLTDDERGNNADVGAAYLYDASSGDLVLTINNPDDTPLSREFFGNGVALSRDRALIGSFGNFENVGSAYLFDLSTGNLLQRLDNPDPGIDVQFGREVAIFEENNLISVSDGAYLFDIP